MRLQTAIESEPAEAAQKPRRLLSLDAYRGLVIAVLVGNQRYFLGIPEIVRHFPNSSIWRWLAYNSDHSAWVGCTWWDMIQPSFMFIVGVAVPYSFASRKSAGYSFANWMQHALLRSILLIAIGIFLISNWAQQTNFNFVDVLAQIGLGYPVIALVADRGFKLKVWLIAVILVSYWAVFAIYPLPGFEMSNKVLDLPQNWTPLTGFFAHWNNRTNFAAAFDRRLLNWFPRAQPFVFEPGGYTTLNFVPSIVTMLLGLVAGDLLRSRVSSRSKLLIMLAAGTGLLTAGLLSGDWVCPIVKRIWTPSWTLYSAGWAFLLLASLYAIIDVRGWQRWAFPFRVFGMNALAAYVVSYLAEDWIAHTLTIHAGWAFSPIYKPLQLSIGVLLIEWLVCYWMYCRKLFIRL